MSVPQFILHTLCQYRNSHCIRYASTAHRAPRAYAVSVLRQLHRIRYASTAHGIAAYAMPVPHIA
eukprot:816592-Rhodomonas_salina.1